MNDLAQMKIKMVNFKYGVNRHKTIFLFYKKKHLIFNVTE